MNRIIFWSTILLIVMGMIYLVLDTLAPFLISFIFAYLLQPAIETNCQRFKLLRTLGTFGVFSLFLSGFITIIGLIVPMTYQQISRLVGKIPQYKSNFEAAISVWSDKLDKIDPELAYKVSLCKALLIDLYSVCIICQSYMTIHACYDKFLCNHCFSANYSLLFS